MKKILILTFSLFTFLIFQNFATAQDVPYVPTSPEVVNGMLKLADVSENDVVYDLGCGDGRIVVAAARDFGATGVGVDSNPERIEESNQNAKNSNVEDKVTFRQENLFETDIKEASVIAIYLLNSVNLKLRPKFLNDLKPGTRIVSHAFDMDDWQPDAHEEIDNRDVYLWIVPENVSGNWTSGANNNNRTDQSNNGNNDNSGSVNQISMNLTQQFQNVSGSVSVNGQSYNISDAKLDGKKLNFTAGSIQFNGEVEDNQLQGTLATDNGEQNITLTRDEESKKALDPTAQQQSIE
jgi:precorrin-6B methylase 2